MSHHNKDYGSLRQEGTKFSLHATLLNAYNVNYDPLPTAPPPSDGGYDEEDKKLPKVSYSHEDRMEVSFVCGFRRKRFVITIGSIVLMVMVGIVLGLYIPRFLRDRCKPVAPGIPSVLDIYDVTSSGLSCRWGRPSFPNVSVTGYAVTVEDETGHGIKSVVTDTNKYSFGELEAWKTYTVKVAAFTTSDPCVSGSVYGNVQTGSARTSMTAPSAPTNPRITKVTSDLIELSWEDPDSPNGPVNGYILNNLNLSPSPNITVTGRRYVFRDLMVWTVYTFSVRAYNVFQGSTLAGPSVTVAAQTGGLPPPYSFGKLSVRSTSADTATLVIPVGLFSSATGPIVEYVLLVECKKNESMSWHQGFEKLDQSGFLTWDQTQGTDQWYRTSPWNWNYETDTRMCKIGDQGTRECSVGLQKSCDATVKYCNGPLQQKSQYWAKVRAYTNFGWTETYPVTFTTTAAGNTARSLSVAVVLIALTVLSWRNGLL